MTENKQYLNDEIFVIPNFISEEEAIKIINYDNTVVEQLRARVGQLFEESYIIDGFGIVRKYVEDEGMELHKDQHDEDCDCGYCIRNPELIKVKGVTIYLNDEYEGGEIIYPDFDIKHKPEALSLVCHSAQHMHEALPVISGQRYAISFFPSVKKEV